MPRSMLWIDSWKGCWPVSSACAVLAMPVGGGRTVGKTSEPPAQISRISVAGWLCFWMLLLFLCLPLCWVGLLMKERRSVCVRCGIRLD